MIRALTILLGLVWLAAVALCAWVARSADLDIVTWWIVRTVCPAMLTITLIIGAASLRALHIKS